MAGASLAWRISCNTCPARTRAGRKPRAECAATAKRSRQYQTAHGLWRQSIACELAWEESSGTGLIAYSMGVALRMGVLDGATYFPVFQKAVQGLADWCLNADFSTERSCRGCLCPGVGAEKGTLKAYLCDVYAYRNEPHSFGPIMLAMIEAHKNGIREIAWKEKMFA